MNVASALADKYDLKPGDPVCISNDNSDKTHILAMAVICLGGIVACTYPKDPYAELLYLSRKVEPRLLFTRGKHAAKWGSQLSKDLGYSVTTIAMDRHELATGFDDLDTFLDYEHEKSSAVIPVKLSTDDLKQLPALITMSSGTTGKPKAVPATHWNVLADLVDSYMFRSQVDFSRVSFACSASLDYVSGRLILFGAVNLGYNAVILNGFNPDTYAQAIEKFRLNTVYIGAASFYEFMTYPNLHKYDLSSLMMIFPMGAKVTYLDELADFVKRYPNIRCIRQGYGASETGGMAMNSMEPGVYFRESENCGTVIPGIYLKVVDQSSGKLLGPNQLGMVHVKGETVFPGYYDAAFQNGKSNGKSNGNGQLNGKRFTFHRDSTIFDEDGFYITGDLGYYNEKEQVHIIGRQKELMSCRSAKKVLPQELEEVVCSHPAVDKVCVLAVKSKRVLLVDLPRAFVVPKREYIDQPELIDKLKEIWPKDGLLTDEEAKGPSGESGTTLVHSGNSNTTLSSLPTEWRRKLAEDVLEFSNKRIGWEKQITGGIVILDDIPTSRATGKMDKNYLRSLTLEQIEIYADQS